VFIKAEIWTVGRTEHGLAALLRLPGSALCVPVYLEDREAQTLLAALTGTESKPPSATSLLASFGTAVAVKPETVEVLPDGGPGHYRAVVHFAGQESRFSLDARTPDALALALRTGARIFLEDSIAENDAIGVSLTETDEPFATQLARLRKELRHRVEREEYEEASDLRDRILRLEKRMRTGGE